MIQKFADNYFTQTVIVCGIIITVLYLLLLFLIEITDLGEFLKAVFWVFLSAYSLFTCLFGLGVIALINNKWIGNVRPFRAYICLAFFRAGVASIFQLVTLFGPVVRTFCSRHNIPSCSC